MDLSKSLPSTTDESSTECAATPVSLLSRLKSPTLVNLAIKWKVRTNPPKGIKKGKGAAAVDPKNVSAADRVNSYPNEYLTPKHYSVVLVVNFLL